jgi:hypothetical protein
MSNLIISPSASRDLNQIAEYFLEVNLEAGEKLFREFNTKDSCKNKLNNFYVKARFSKLLKINFVQLIFT